MKQRRSLMHWFFLIVFLFSHGVAQGNSCKENVLFCPWLPYYGPSVELETFEPYNPLILKPEFFPDAPAKLKPKIICARLAVAQIENNPGLFSEAEKLGLILFENPKQPGNYYVDVRKEGWMRLLLDKIIPNLLVHGYNGLMLDTLYDAEALEFHDPETYKGMSDAAIQIVQLINVYFPTVYLLLANSYKILPQVTPFVQGFVAESLYSQYDQDKKTYTLVAADQYQTRVKAVLDTFREDPHLQLFSLDYWDSNQSEEISKIYEKERSHGFRPYVGSYGLNSVISEPRKS